MLASLEIIPFEKNHANAFKALNIRWLKEFFKVEPIDEKVLSNVDEYIIKKGGFIFMGKIQQEIVGCFAIIPLKNGDFELSKMAVNPKFQGNKIGETLLSYAIEFSKKQAWPKIILYSSRQLENAIHLYRKKGFVEIPVEKEVHYERCDIKMELIF
ncbi:GNAT family N-acetyltransferase [Flavobacteriaceae bacterium]|jgi:ribosomal protein S18 acetylase RimI-like enzyme|nr:GCN5-related N-acetyltransferase [Flavobacteria bacterium MS024-3C]MDA9928883.1 GNAT family N-acetyltransferase [Flavobacteriaceae bacterium]MDB4047455.1 GNAT family N-acetyltransferase [Flavobacteriaceae bacterium]MDB4068301.1 GNAT family N-acetyltransferase [Flavobacteriaceae bacterium]MDB9730164.1 GNAT family N-acetyltransferase [Flavobacteriaceae bacterium]